MGFKDKMRKRMMQNITPSETQVGQHLVHILATTEYQLFDAIDRLVEAADAVDGEFVVAEEMDDRRERLLALADAVAEQRVEEWWWSEVAPDVLEQPDVARKCAGLSKSEWRAKIESWAEMYRDAGADVDGMTDAQIADLHVRESFGMGLAEFSQEIVEWSAAAHVEGIVRRNFRVSTQTIHQVAAQLEEADVADGVEQGAEDVAEGRTSSMDDLEDAVDS